MLSASASRLRGTAQRLLRRPSRNAAMPMLSTAAKLPPRGSNPRPTKGTDSFLAAEIGRMKKAYEKYNKTPPKPFKLKDNSGKLEFLLHRRKGSEDIQVKCEFLHHPRGGPPEDLSPEELEGHEQRPIVDLTMIITKGGPEALEMNVQCDRNGYSVSHIKYRKDKDVNFEDDDEYFPEFRKISSKLRAELQRYLESQGLDERLAAWVHDQMDDKAFQERLRQLEKINAFIELKSK